LVGKKRILEQILLLVEELGQQVAQAMYEGTFDPTKIYALRGCRNSTVAPNYTVGLGVAYYNGEMFFLDATTFVAAATAVVVINTTYNSGADGDPFTFTDGSSHNVLEIRRMSVVDGSGATPGFVANYADVVFKGLPVYVTPTLINGWTGTFKYYIDGNGILHTEGTLDATAATNIVSCNLPVGARPLTNAFGVEVFNFTDTLTAYVRVGTSGNVSMDIGYIVGKLYTCVNMEYPTI